MSIFDEAALYIYAVKYRLSLDELNAGNFAHAAQEFGLYTQPWVIPASIPVFSDDARFKVIFSEDGNCESGYETINKSAVADGGKQLWKMIIKRIDDAD